jgi:hypothetical protein
MFDICNTLNEIIDTKETLAKYNESGLCKLKCHKCIYRTHRRNLNMKYKEFTNYFGIVGANQNL